MGSFKHPHAFDPLDLQIIDRVYEAAWAQVEARDPSRDRQKDGERRKALKKLVFALAASGHVDFDSLLDNVLASVPELARYPESVTGPLKKKPGLGSEKRAR
jgi:hypothetical protein